MNKLDSSNVNRTAGKHSGFFVVSQICPILGFFGITILFVAPCTYAEQLTY